MQNIWGTPPSQHAGVAYHTGFWYDFIHMLHPRRGAWVQLQSAERPLASASESEAAG